MNKTVKKILSIILVFALILTNLAGIGVKNTYAAIDNTYIDELLKDIKAPYDVIIGLDYFGEDANSLSRKEKADLAQKDLLELLENEKKSGNVEDYKSFYITNAVHAIINSKDLLYKISSLKNVIKITKNSKVHLIKPIEDKDKMETYSYIYEPDERRIEWGVSLVHADKVWEDYNITGKGVTVGIIDTGVNYKLPAIKKNFKGYNEETGEIDRSYYKDFVDGFLEPMEDHVNDHGTHVAGTICGVEGENLNRIGVAPNVKYISARALNDQGGETSNLLDAAQWMLEQKPDVINNSWGGDSDADAWFSDVAQAWKEAGIVGVFAAGNQGGFEPTPGLGTVANPGNLLNVLTVGAVDINKKIGSFSKKGPSAFDKTGKIIKPEIVAPGVQVRSIDALGNYVSWNGTSMATPHVVGVIALIKEANPNLSVDEIVSLVEQSAEPLSDRKYIGSPNMAYGYGLINAYDAIAKLKGRDLGSIFGKVVKDGRDTSAASAEFKSENEAYLGRDYNVNLALKDDVSIREAKVYYKFNEDTQEKVLDLNFDTGEQNDGIYKAVISSNDLKSGILKLRVEVKDYANNLTTVTKEVSVNSGVSLPWTFDFENDLSGFITEGNWYLSKRLSNAEPAMLEGSKQYIGINGGSAKFKPSEDSFLYLPPIDISSLNENDNLTLSADVYNGFLGFCTAQIQVKYNNENEWKTIYNTILRPDIEERKWEHNTYSLKDYIKGDKPLLIRFYFRGRGDGVGWYLDNLKISTNENKAPDKIKGFKTSIENTGLKLSFIKNEETDIKDYVIEKKVDEGEFTELSTIKQGANEDFIAREGEIASHFEVSYLDTDVENGKKYTYRVKVRDISDNESEYSSEVSINYTNLRTTVEYNFEDNDGNFEKGVLNNEINDWEYGQAVLPKEWETGTLIYQNIYSGFNKNNTKMWGTKLSEAMSHGAKVVQDSYLKMPSFTVSEGDYFYFDSFSITKSFDRTISFTVDIREEGTENWDSLFKKEDIQDVDTSSAWHTLSTSLDKYKDKTVEVRFRVQTNGKGIKDDYNIGWYIDNIFVGEKKPEVGTTTFANNDEIEVYNDLEETDVYTMSGEENTNIDVANSVPLVAKLSILETGKYTYSSEVDGSYKLGHSINLPDKPYTLAISSYGYETEFKKIDLSENHNKELNFMLKPAKKSGIQGSVIGGENENIQGATIRVVDDDKIGEVNTDTDGKFKLDNVYTGEHRLRIYKEGYIPKEIDIKLTEKSLDVSSIKLEKLPKLLEKEIDYGFNVEKTDDKYQTVHFRTGMKGAAVRFQSPFEGGILKSAKLFLASNEYYSGKHIQIGVIAYDKEGRLRELAPFKEYPNLKANDWNEIDFGEYYIRRDEPIYIATRYDTELYDSLGLYYDVKAEAKAKARSFVYDGSFISTNVLAGAGAFAIKTTWLYEENARENKETEYDETSSNIGGEIRPVNELEFEFDESTGTITKYKGNNPIVSIPRKIKGVDVKHIGDYAFNKINKPYEEKLKTLIIPEGIETIGKGSFINNRLSTVKLPSTLKEIGEEAFRFQYKDSSYGSTAFNINIPENIKIIKKHTFESAGSPLLIEEASGLERIEKEAFTYNKKIEINAYNLKEIEDGAFGNNRSMDFEYAKVYTNKDTKLRSKTGEYLINPALVTINFIDAKDDENILKIGLKYGIGNLKSYSRDNDVENYYKMGDKVEIKPFDIEKDNKSYTSIDKSIELILEKDNKIDFLYYLTEAQLRKPILDVDKKILGFSLPNADIKVEVNGEIYTTRANEDGFFELAVDKLNANSVVKISANDKKKSEVLVEVYKGDEFIVKDGKLLRYMGNEKDVIIPIAVGNSADIKEIGDFAFYNKGLKSVVIPEKVATIGAGAFLDNELEKFSFNLNNINLSTLRIIKEYAFKNNKIKSIKEMPELTHVIQTKAFENNKIEELKLAKYMGHIGKAAFKNNLIKKLDLTGNIEEIGEEAFMNNEISELKFLDPVNASEHMEGLTKIAAGVFAGNNFTTVNIPDKIKHIDETAFENNKKGIPTLKTDEPGILASKNFNVLRSDGTLLRYGDVSKEEQTKDEINSTTQNGNSLRVSSGGSSSSNRFLNKAYLPTGYMGKTKVLFGNVVPDIVESPNWVLNTKTNKWQLIDANGNIVKNTWKLVYIKDFDTTKNILPYAWFAFDENGNMRTSWFKEGSYWYHLNTSKDKYEGSLSLAWQKIDNKWYYFETKFGVDMGKMYSDRQTPDGYYVNNEGVYVPNK